MAVTDAGISHAVRHAHRPETTDKVPRQALKIDSVFCDAGGADPFDTVAWELRSAAIKDENGQVLFEQHDCDIPAGWSQLATNVVVSKYFYGELGTAERESSVRQLIHRVSRTIADWGIEDGYFVTRADGERFYRELTWLCLHQHGAFNSPVWFNVGLYHQYGVKGSQCSWSWDPEQQAVHRPDNPYEYPQASACFIQHVQDNMEDIMELARSEAMLFKFGSGTGTDLSTLRSHREKLSGGGRPSGPLSFMRVYDQIAAVVKSGGKTRRAAKMQSLKVWHPDIMEFIECKDKEEQKARVLIEHGGYEANFNGEAYSSIMFQNANLSVRVTDEFMQAVEQDQPWATRWVTDPAREGPTYPAREILHRMAQCAWSCGDPGVQYDTTVNHWHTCPQSGRINASNPCSEYMFLDDTACNLASINLMKFRRPNGSFDSDRFAAACRIFFIAQEILVDHSSYPTREIARNSHLFRPLGLGYSNLGSLIMTSGMPYDSDAARGLCGAITALLHGAANLASVELARAAGPFEAYSENRLPMLRVMEMHRDKVRQIHEEGPPDLKEAAARLWDEVVRQGERFGFRNAQATVLAPTGTISFLMDCDTTGIEPEIALVKYKQLAGRGMLKMVNQTVPVALHAIDYDQPRIDAILAYIQEHDSIEGAPDLKAEHLPVFDCAFTPRNGTRSISWRAHVAMMAAAQPFLSGAISKTVNMPRDTTPEEVAGAYIDGWKMGLKALAIYRDGSKESQPLSTSSESDRAAAKSLAAPRRERLPDTRRSITHKFNVSGHEGYITVGLYDDGRPGEVFLTMAKEGSTVGGLMDAFGTAISMSLQYGVPLEDYVKKFSHTRFEPMGYTKNAEIRIAKSIIDYIFRWLGITFLPGFREEAARSQSRPAPASQTASETSAALPPDTEASAPRHRTARQTESAPADKTDNGPSSGTNGQGRTATAPRSGANATAIVAPEAASDTQAASAAGRYANAVDQFASFQSDAPACDHCGAITVRNGNCYLCHNCGNSMGCS